MAEEIQSTEGLKTEKQIHELIGKPLRIPRRWWMDEARKPDGMPSIVIAGRTYFSIPAVNEYLAKLASTPSKVPPKKKAPASAFGRKTNGATAPAQAAAS